MHSKQIRDKWKCNQSKSWKKLSDFRQLNSLMCNVKIWAKFVEITICRASLNKLCFYHVCRLFSCMKYYSLIISMFHYIDFLPQKVLGKLTHLGQCRSQSGRTQVDLQMSVDDWKLTTFFITNAITKNAKRRKLNYNNL